MAVVTDPVSDMLTRIRNAHHALQAEVKAPMSRLKESIAAILKQEGYISDFKTDDKEITMELRYHDGKPLIAGLRRVSKPGRRVYAGAADIPRVQNGLGICIVSTSSGLLEGGAAKEKNVGGEILCEVW